MLTFDQKTVLVTGATGLIGSHIVDALMAMGTVRVVALSRSKEKLEAGFAEYFSDHNFACLAQDISAPLYVQEHIDFIFHAAGPMEGKIIANSPVDVINPNLIGTKNCLDLLRRQESENGLRGRMVVFSSVTVYRNLTDHDLSVCEGDTAITEALDAKNAPYSQSKRMAEVLALAYHKQYHIDVVLARLSTIYGDTRFRPDTAFFEFIRKAVAGEDIVLNGVGMPRRDNIYIDDAVSALLTVCQKGVDGEAYNVSSYAEQDNFAAVDEIAQAIAVAANKKFGRDGANAVKVHYKDDVRNPGLMLDNTKLKSLGWTLKTSLEQGIINAVTSYAACPQQPYHDKSRGYFCDMIKIGKD